MRLLLPALLVCSGVLASGLICTPGYLGILFEGSPPPILSVDREISDSGGSHAGVYAVSTEIGPLALKVRNLPWPMKAEALEVHKELALRGLAPKVYGVIEGDALSALRPAMKEKQTGKKFLSPLKTDQGVLMELLPKGWNCPASESPMPEAAKNWDKDAILKRIDEMEVALAEMNVRVLNPQIFIDEAGTAHLIDIEMVFRGSAEKPANTSLHSIREGFLEAWEKRPK